MARRTEGGNAGNGFQSMSSGRIDLKTVWPGRWVRTIAGPSDQLGVQSDRGFEDLGDRAVLLGIAGHSSKRSFVHVRHLGAQRQSRPTDAESLALWLKRDR